MVALAPGSPPPRGKWQMVLENENKLLRQRLTALGTPGELLFQVRLSLLRPSVICLFLKLVVAAGFAGQGSVRGLVTLLVILSALVSSLSRPLLLSVSVQV